MNLLMKLQLQHRWKIVCDHGQSFLVYYGLRLPPYHLSQVRPLSAAATRDIALLDGTRVLPQVAENKDVMLELTKLVEDKILVTECDLRSSATKNLYQTCKRCVNNDLLIPGLEFDDDGICSFCKCYDVGCIDNQAMTSCISDDLLLGMTKKHGGTHDVMLMYTGGKDSSFLLWYLARKLGLRVLAAYWDMPYAQPTARENIQNAIKRLPDVAFVQWTLPRSTFINAMRGNFMAIGCPCLCLAVIIPLFYSLAQKNRIPCVMLGVEEVQLSINEYVFCQPVHDAHLDALSSRRQATLAFLENLTEPQPLVQPIRYHQELQNFYSSVRQQLDIQFRPLTHLVKRAQVNPSIHLPLICRLRTNQAYGTWEQVIKIIGKELDWRMPLRQNSQLHTSCQIEGVKDYVQYIRFKNCRTVFFPQSVVELSASVYFGLVTRDQALQQLNELTYLEPPPILWTILDDLNIDTDNLHCCTEMFYSLEEALHARTIATDCTIRK